MTIVTCWIFLSFMEYFPENNVRTHVHLQVLQHPSLRLSMPKSAAVTCIILLGDKKRATEMFGCHWAAGWLCCVTSMLFSSCLSVVRLPLWWRGQCPACLTVTFPFSWGAMHTNSYLLIYFHYYDSTKGNREHRLSEAFQSSSRLNLDVFVLLQWCKLNHYSRRLDRIVHGELKIKWPLAW